MKDRRLREGKSKNAMFPVRSSAYEWESVRVSLKREPFEIRIPKHKRAVQICAWTDDSIFQLTEGLSNARPRSEVQFYRPGTGLADSEYYSAILKLSNDAHMYLTGNRLASASPEFDRAYFATVWSATDDSDAPKPMKQQTEDLFLTVYVDLDDDEYIDRGEFEYVVLDF